MFATTTYQLVLGSGDTFNSKAAAHRAVVSLSFWGEGLLVHCDADYSHDQTEIDVAFKAVSSEIVSFTGDTASRWCLAQVGISRYSAQFQGHALQAVRHWVLAVRACSLH